MHTIQKRYTEDAGLPPGCHNLDPSAEQTPPEGFLLRFKYGTPVSDGSCLLWNGRRYIEVGSEHTHISGSERWDLINLTSDALDATRARGKPLIIDGFDQRRDSLALPGLGEGSLASLSYQVMMSERENYYYLDYDSSFGFLLDIDNGQYVAIILKPFLGLQWQTEKLQSQEAEPEPRNILSELRDLARYPEYFTPADIEDIVQDLRAGALESLPSDTASDTTVDSGMGLGSLDEKTDITTGKFIPDAPLFGVVLDAVIELSLTGQHSYPDTDLWW